MFKAVSRELITLDKKIAQNWKIFNTYGGQRPIREKHLGALIAKQDAGLFNTGHIALAKMKFNGGNTVMMDGQHQIEMVLKTGKPISVVVEKFECVDPQEASLLFRQFNSDARRSLQDKVRAEAFSLGIDWPARYVNLLVSSAAVREGKANVIDDKKVELLKSYLNFGTFLKEILCDENQNLMNKGAGHLLRSAVIHSIILTWEKGKEDSKKFWISVRDGEELKRNMPALKLRTYLLNTSIAIGRGATKGASFRLATNHEMTSKCITAWNAYRRGEATDLKYYANKSIPRAI